MAHFTLKEILDLDQRFRTSLINSLTGFKSVALIGTKDLDGCTNLAIFNSLVHIGANPPYIGFISRPDSVERHTLENIISTRMYTINQIHESMYVQAHQTSARYSKETSEFEATGLTDEYKGGFFAPFVLQSRIQLAVELKEIVPISLNQTSLVIGQIMDVYLPDECLNTDGYVDIEKAGSITNTGLDSYHKTTLLGRLTYAKPNTTPEKL